MLIYYLEPGSVKWEQLILIKKDSKYKLDIDNKCNYSDRL